MSEHHVSMMVGRFMLSTFVKSTVEFKQGDCKWSEEIKRCLSWLLTVLYLVSNLGRNLGSLWSGARPASRLEALCGEREVHKCFVRVCTASAQTGKLLIILL